MAAATTASTATGSAFMGHASPGRLAVLTNAEASRLRSSPGGAGTPTSTKAQHLNSSSTSHTGSIQPALILLLFGFAGLLRIMIGFHPHSGQNNYHGSKVAYGGDYEAQRHWMELTLHLPSIGDWYWYDLDYWGLDYPPLTAYVSWLCGWVSHHVVGPHSVAFVTSRGIEDPITKAFLRATVLVLDLAVFGTAVWYAAYKRDRKSLWTVLITLVQPAIILIDHGHFQYNTVALGLAVTAFGYMSQQGYHVWDRTTSFAPCLWGGFFFCLALNFKQMTLYYAPAVFFYLLGRCMAKGPRQFLTRLLTLGLVVIFTFLVLWEPFVKYPPTHAQSFTSEFASQYSIDNPPTHLQRLKHVLRRIFPFQRGLFEGKVANVWCALNTHPIKIRDRIPADKQPLMALALTVLLMIPSCWKMFRMGLLEFRGGNDTNIHNLQNYVITQQFLAVRRHQHWHWVQLLWAMTSCSLSFFLASFQVHEKSILLTLAPCSLLLWQDPIFVEWFSLVCVWTLWPLLQVDQLKVAYLCCVVIFMSLVWFRRMGMGQMNVATVFSRGKLGNLLSFVPLFLWSAIPTLSYLIMLGLHVAQLLVPTPVPALPDLYEVLWSAVGCGLFCVAWIAIVFKMYGAPYPANYVVTRKAKVTINTPGAREQSKAKED